MWLFFCHLVGAGLLSEGNPTNETFTYYGSRTGYPFILRYISTTQFTWRIPRTVVRFILVFPHSNCLASIIKDTGQGRLDFLSLVSLLASTTTKSRNGYNEAPQVENGNNGAPNDGKKRGKKKESDQIDRGHIPWTKGEFAVSIRLLSSLL